MVDSDIVVSKFKRQLSLAQSAGAVEYTDGFSAEG